MIALMLAAVACDEVDGLISKLGADRFEQREAATHDLMKRRDARDRLAATLEKTDDLEVAVRLRRVLAHLDRLLEAAGLHLEIDAAGARQEPAAVKRTRIVRLKTGYAADVAGPLTYDREDPRPAWLPILETEIGRPFEIDPPAGLELLTQFGGFPELIPALRERATSSDPLVKHLCEQAIIKQGGTP